MSILFPFRKNARSHPTLKGTGQAGFILLRDLIEKLNEFSPRQKGKTRTFLSLLILAIRPEAKDSKGLAIKPPNLRDSQGRIYGHSVDRAARDIDFDGQVRRRIVGKIQRVLAPHQQLMLNVVTFVRLQAFALFLFFGRQDFPIDFL